MALENARYNKYKMRLRRDSQGNYTYQYVADEQKLSDLQSALANAQSQLYNMDKEHYKQQLNQMYSTYKDYLQQMAELERQYEATTDEAEKERLSRQMDLLRDKYSDYFDNIGEDLQYTLQHYLTESFGQAMNIEMGKYSPAQQIQLLKENLPYTNSQMQVLSEEIQKQGGIVKATADYYNELAIAAREAAAAQKEALEAGGTSEEEVKEGRVSEKDISQVEEYLRVYTDADNAAKEALQSTKDLLDTVDAFLDKEIYNDIDKITESLQGVYETLQNINNLKGANGSKILEIFSSDDNQLSKNQSSTSPLVQKLQTRFNKNLKTYESAHAKSDSILAAMKSTENISTSQAAKWAKNLETYQQTMYKAYNNMALTGQKAEEKNITINAEFPNVADHNEIQKAIENLTARASQEAASNKK